MFSLIGIQTCYVSLKGVAGHEPVCTKRAISREHLDAVRRWNVRSFERLQKPMSVVAFKLSRTSIVE